MLSKELLRKFFDHDFSSRPDFEDSRLLQQLNED